MLWILCLWLLVVGIALLANRPSTGYEPSIYAAVPPMTWVILEACVLGGLISAVWAAINPRTSNTNAWAMGFGIVVAVAVVVSLAPVLRGYAGSGRSDILGHIGRAEDIQLYGRIPEYDRPSSVPLYPVLHILLVQISLVTGLTLFALAQYTALATYLMGVLFTYLLARTIARYSVEVALCMLASTTLLLSKMNYQVLPTALGYSMSLLVLYAYLQVATRDSPVHRFVFILAGVIYPFVHPIACISLLLGLIAMEVYAVARRTKRSTQRSVTNLRSSSIVRGTLSISILIVIITLVTWLWYNWYFWQVTIHQIVNLITIIGQGSYAYALSELELVRISVLDTIMLLPKIHGHHILYILLAAIGSITVFKKTTSGYDITLRKLRRVVIFLGAQVFTLLLYLFGGSKTVSYWRALAPILLVTPVMLGHLGFQSYRKYVQEPRNGKHRATAANWFLTGATALLLLAFSIGVFSFFFSPYTYRLSHQISHAELQGMAWFTQHRDETIPVDSLTLKYVFAAALEGFKVVDRQLGPIHQKWGELRAPDHFDYTLERKVAERAPIYYLPIHVQDRLYYTVIQRNPVRFLQSDFDKLPHTSTFGKVYTNGELDVWWVRTGYD